MPRWSPTSGRRLPLQCVIFHNLYLIIRCYGVRIVPTEGGEKGDISEMVETLATYLQNMEVRRDVILERALQYHILLNFQ